MVLGYFFAELYVMRLFDETMGLAAALRTSGKPGSGGVCTVVGYLLCVALERFKVTKFIAVKIKMKN